MFDLYCIGEFLIDFIPGAESASYIRKAGGAPANVAIAAAKNGLQAAMCCKVGEDDFGHFLMDTLKEQHVTPVSDGYCDEAVTTMAFVTLKEDGDRVFTFARKPGADMLLEEKDVKEEDIRESAIVHAGSFTLSAGPAREATRKALRLGHEAGALVSFDVNYRNVVWKDDVRACADAVFEILPYVDLLKISDEEVEMMGGQDAIPALMEKYHVSVVVETLGADGAQAFFGPEVIRVKGQKVRAVDTTGAGDAFWGAFLSSLRLQGVSAVRDLTAQILEQAIRYGNASGCICVQSKGAIASIPTREEIEKWMESAR